MADLGISKAPHLPPTSSPEAKAPRFPALHVFICDSCFLVQAPNHRFDQPFFISNDSDLDSFSRQQRATHFTDRMINRFGLTPENLVIQHTCNDGDFLPDFQRANIPVLGIEARAPASPHQRQHDIPSIVERFGGDVAERLTAEHRQADLFISNHSLNGVPDLNDFVLGIQTVLKPEGIFTLEFPHLLRRMAQNQATAPDAEDDSYFSLFTVEKIFAHHGLTIFDVESLPDHGGSLRLYGRHDAHHELAVTANVLAIRALEHSAGLDKLETYQVGKRRHRWSES
jgi:SAM-dependent methyltransferase